MTELIKTMEGWI